MTAQRVGRPNRQDLLKVAAASGLDPRTVERAIYGDDGNGKPRSAATRAAIVTALKRAGFEREARDAERRWAT